MGKVITPLDTCGNVVLDGRALCEDPPAATQQNGPASAPGICLDNHLAWFEAVKHWPILKNLNAQNQSSVLYILSPST